MKINVPKVGCIDIGPKGMIVLGILVLGSPTATVYSTSLLLFLDRLLAILSDNAKLLMALVGV